MSAAAAPLDWRRDGGDWPLRDSSHFVEAGGLRWHLQHLAGPAAAPLALLLHGTGASTHSWRGLAPLLAQRFEVLAVDLPGHAFTSLPQAHGLSLPGMARLLRTLLDASGLQPAIVIGHSAGAAIAVRMALDGLLPAATRLVAINGAFMPYGGSAAALLSPIARLLHASPWVPKLFSRRAQDLAVVQRLIAGTGSTLDERGIELYGRLIRCPAHARAALGMMAHWDLQALPRELVGLQPRLELLVGDNDRAVSPRQARRVVALRPGTTLALLTRLGHLAHEEDPARVAALIAA